MIFICCFPEVWTGDDSFEEVHVQELEDCGGFDEDVEMLDNEHPANKRERCRKMSSYNVPSVARFNSGQC
jgi:hypothetical protein